MNVEALRILRNEPRPLTAGQRSVLRNWSGWGAVPAVFDEQAAAYERFAWARTALRELMTESEHAAAQRSTLNAHYTDPGYVRAIWDALKKLGFSGGRVLEPGCGSGNFLERAPENTTLVGVELEPMTAAVAQALHPQAQIRCESFAETRFGDNSFDVVVGNVPFGDVTLHDRRHNAAGHRIHNHFLLKSLHLTRPGGVMALITSRYTMDAMNPAARRELAALGDLLGAVRLPSGAHRRAAGTDVVTDVLIFRRREDGAPARGARFEGTRALELDGAEAVRINEYFIEHPHHVLGTLHATQGDRGRPELGVAGDRDASNPLAAALSEITERALALGLAHAPTAYSAPPAAVAHVDTSAARPDGFLRALEDGSFLRLEQGLEVPYRPPAPQARELQALLGLRDTAVTLLEAEAGSVEDTPEMDALRKQLNDRYDAYTRAHGPLNRFTERRTGHVDAETGVEKVARVRPPQGRFRGDPFANVVFALEHFDASSQTATKATLFRERVIARRAPQLGADTPADALAICLDTFGEARLTEIARLLGVDERAARAQLGTLVFDEPGTDRLVPAPEYLSGNVRSKLALATEAADTDPRFEPNVLALTGVLPRELAPEEIHARLGAAWISARYVRQFLRETLEDNSITVEHPGGTIWTVHSSRPDSVEATSRWGTERYNAIQIAQALLEQRQIRIYDETHDGKRVFNTEATVAADAKATELSERFSQWIWQDPERAAQLAKTYNERFNAIVPRSYDDAKLSLPGLAITFKPRPHQFAAVARIINEPAVGLFHDVGAGKTAEMVMGAMELRRLGLVRKPVVVVPNHMLEQFSREWLQLYPQARLLAAAKEDLDRDRRRLFVARCATGDWDAVVMTRSAFERVPVSPEVQKDYLEREVAAATALVERAKAASSSRITLKRIERMRLNAEERLKGKLDGAKDPGISFEQLGVDYLFVDEAHAYKNLRTSSNIPGMSVDGSQRASDLHMKLEYLRSQHSRVATLATATPIANSIGEAFTMQRYLRPDLLEQAGIVDHDQWAATFGETTTAIEVSPDGSGLRMQTRFSRFRNVPELLALWRVSADIKTAEDLKLPVPALVPRASDSQRLPETVVVAPSQELRWYMEELSERADRVRSRGVHPSSDNMLSVSSDGRAAGLDLRLVGRPTEEMQKVDVAAARITAVYEQHRDTSYPGPDGTPHAIRGALQIVFCDLGTPKPGEWSVYDELRAQLVARGLPRESVRFMHEAQNDRAKGELFAACRDGRVSVIVGSTERMGVGTNVQLRAVALHHLDCPWRPADIAQREGRILRQGNANPEVRILRYVTEGSFDAYLWQTVTRKAQFIAQVMRGRLDIREIEDIGEAALSYNEVKALATGNPLLLEHARAQAEVTRLERLERSHMNNLDVMRRTIRSHSARIGYLQERVVAADAVIARGIDMTGESLTVRVGGRAFAKRAEGNEHLRHAAASYYTRKTQQSHLGEINGHPIVVTGREARGIQLVMKGVPEAEVFVAAEELSQVSLVTRFDNKLRKVPELRDSDRRTIARLEGEITRANRELGEPFRYASTLDEERARLREIEQQLHSQAELVAPHTQTAATPAPDAPEYVLRSVQVRGERLVARLRSSDGRDVVVDPYDPGEVRFSVGDRVRIAGSGRLERLCSTRERSIEL